MRKGATIISKMHQKSQDYLSKNGIRIENKSIKAESPSRPHLYMNIYDSCQQQCAMASKEKFYYLDPDDGEFYWVERFSAGVAFQLFVEPGSLMDYATGVHFMGRPGYQDHHEWLLVEVPFNLDKEMTECLRKRYSDVADYSDFGCYMLPVICKLEEHYKNDGSLVGRILDAGARHALSYFLENYSHRHIMGGDRMKKDDVGKMQSKGRFPTNVGMQRLEMMMGDKR